MASLCFYVYIPFFHSELPIPQDLPLPRVRVCPAVELEAHRRGLALGKDLKGVPAVAAEGVGEVLQLKKRSFV